MHDVCDALHHFVSSILGEDFRESQQVTHILILFLDFHDHGGNGIQRISHLVGHKGVDDLLEPFLADQLLKFDGRRRDVDELEHETLLLVNGVGSLLDLVEVRLLYLICINRRA